MQWPRRALQHKRPLWLGMLLATMAPWLCVTPWLALSGPLADALDLLRLSVLAFLFVVPVATIASIFAGLPYILWLRSRGRLNIYTALLGSMVIGALALALLLGTHELGHFLVGAALGSFQGWHFAWARGLAIHPGRCRFAGRLGQAPDGTGRAPREIELVPKEPDGGRLVACLERARIPNGGHRGSQ